MRGAILYGPRDVGFRSAGSIGYVGVPHRVVLKSEELFFAHLHGGPALVRRFLPELIDLVWNGKVPSRQSFDLTLPLQSSGRGL